MRTNWKTKGMFRMDKTLETFVLMLCLMAGFVYNRKPLPTAKADPCKDYLVLTEQILDVSYTNLTNKYSAIYGTQWYRYLDTGEGILTTTCPSGTQCGTTEQVWLNDTLPSYSDGATFVNVCYKNATHCCDSTGNLRVQNCGTFLVYFLVPQNPPRRWCFDKRLIPLASENNAAGSDTEATGSNIGLIIGAVCGAVIAAAGLIALGVIVVMRQKKKKASADATSRQDSNAVENDKSPEKPINGT